MDSRQKWTLLRVWEILTGVVLQRAKVVRNKISYSNKWTKRCLLWITRDLTNSLNHTSQTQMKRLSKDASSFLVGLIWKMEVLFHWTSSYLTLMIQNRGKTAQSPSRLMIWLSSSALMYWWVLRNWFPTSKRPSDLTTLKLSHAIWIWRWKFAVMLPSIIWEHRLWNRVHIQRKLSKTTWFIYSTKRDKQNSEISMTLKNTIRSRNKRTRIIPFS